MFTCYLYVFGLVLPDGKSTAQEAFDYGKSKGYSFTLHDPRGRRLLSWERTRGVFDREPGVEVV